MLTRLFAAIRQLRHPGFSPPIIDRRCLRSRAFDGGPRRRQSDVWLLIAEHEGDNTLFACRDAKTRAVVRRIDYFDDTHPVKGVVIVNHHGLEARIDYEWHYDGRVFAAEYHNWDIVGLADQGVEAAA